MRHKFVRLDWVELEEFPKYEINSIGIVRQKKTGVEHSIQAYNYETVMLTKDGKRYHRSVKTLLILAFPELYKKS